MKMGAVVKEVCDGALKWFKMAGWKEIDEKEAKANETNSKKAPTK